jgi:hypothetical protein
VGQEWDGPQDSHGPIKQGSLPTPNRVIGQSLPRELADIERQRIVGEVIRSGRSKRGSPCPVCGDTDGQCFAYVPVERGAIAHVWCVRGADRPGGMLLADWGFRRDLGGIWYFEWDEKQGAPRLQPTRALSDKRPVADAATIDRVLQAVADYFGLSTTHKEQLAARGYDLVTCGPHARFAFASLPADLADRMRVVSRLLGHGAARSEGELLGVYGFEQDRRHGPSAPIAFLPRVAGPALLEFRLDDEGRVTGFQYAPDTPERDAKGKPQKRLTPARMAIRDHYHVARPANDAGAEVWHTESIHKANLVADHRNAIALGSLGAGNARSLAAGALAVDPRARRLHVVALDSDQWGGQAEKQVATTLAEKHCRVALARWDPAHKGPDDAIAGGASFTLEPFVDERRKPKTDQRVTHAHAWQRCDETPEERQALLQDIASHDIAVRVRAHIDADERERVLILASPPGVGKSHTVAELGQPTTAHPNGEYDLAWIAERHEMAGSNPALARFREIEPPSATNCDAYEAARELAQKGFNTGRFHALHECEYQGQFRAEGSALFQLAHVQTSYPASHQAIVVDEMDVGKWLRERAFTTSRLQAAAATFPTDSYADLLLRAIQAVITDAQQAGRQAREDDQVYQAPHGRALFDALDQHAGGQLVAWLGALGDDSRATVLRPDAGIEPDDPGEALERAEVLKPVVLPHIWHALAGEVAAWRRGGEWNSCLRIGPATAGGEWGLHMTEPFTFGRTKGASLPPRITLDATADPEIHARLLGAPVEIVQTPVPPPPNMRHIAVRTRWTRGEQTGMKRYGKVSLTSGASQERDLRRAAAEARYVLNELDPSGALRASGGVGLITYMGCEQQLAEALDLPYGERTGHFWAMRGSNKLEDCAILLVVGTPTPDPADVKRWTRALYSNDPAPLDETVERSGDGWRYQDPRLQGVAEYLTRAELTQCAHRNRPMRHDGRTVVTFCAGEIDFLPITTEITSLPQLTGEGESRSSMRDARNAQRFQQAIEALQAEGVKITTRAVAAKASVSLREVSPWMRENAARYDNLRAIPDVQYSSNSKVGINSEIDIKRGTLTATDSLVVESDEVIPPRLAEILTRSAARTMIRAWAVEHNWPLLKAPLAHTYGGSRERWELLLHGGDLADFVRVIEAFTAGESQIGARP